MGYKIGYGNEVLGKHRRWVIPGSRLFNLPRARKNIPAPGVRVKAAPLHFVPGVFTWRAALEWTRADRVEPRFAPDAGSVSRRGNRYALSRNNPSWSRSTR